MAPLRRLVEGGNGQRLAGMAGRRHGRAMIASRMPNAGSHLARSLAVILFLVGTAEAALPPQAQRSREFSQVIEEAARLLEAPIDAVERVDAVLYKVRAGACHLFVRVVFKPRSDPGPALFSVIPGKPQCP